jgi:hypothetical protein
MIKNFVQPHKISSIYPDKQKKFVPKKVTRIAQFHCNWVAVFPSTKDLFELNSGFFHTYLIEFTPHWPYHRIKVIQRQISCIISFVEEKTTIQLQWNCASFVTFRNKTFLFVKINKWNFVRFHEIHNHNDAENFSFYPDKQISWVESLLPFCAWLFQRCKKQSYLI